MRKVIVLAGLAAALLIGCGRESAGPTFADRSDVQQGRMPADLAATLEENSARESDAEIKAAEHGWDGDIAAGLWETYDVYAVTIAWGDIFGNPATIPTATDWSGTLTLANVPGLVEARGAIDFERGEDSVIRTEDVPFAQWVSATRRDIDGLSFLVFVSKVSTGAMPPAVQFATEPFQLELSQSELAEYAAFFRVGEDKGVAVLSRQIWPRACPGGFIKGEWMLTGAVSDSGFFSGLWVDREGEPLGIMTARYRTLDNGERVFDGAISGVTATVVLGFVKGVWAYDDYRDCIMCGQSRGWFRGRAEWIAPSPFEGQEGGFGGVFGDLSLPVETRVLPLRGAWRVDCPNTTEVVIPEED